MKLLKCYNCESPLLIGGDDSESINAQVSCFRCGKTDYVHAFMRGGGRRTSDQMHTSIDGSFFEIIRDLSSYGDNVALDQSIRDLSREYGVSPLTVVSITNAFIGTEGSDTSYNPTKFVELVPDKVSASDVMDLVKESIIKLSSETSNRKKATDASSGATGWKQMYDEVNVKLSELQREYDSLLMDLKRIVSEKKELEEIINNR